MNYYIQIYVILPCTYVRIWYLLICMNVVCPLMYEYKRPSMVWFIIIFSTIVIVSRHTQGPPVNVLVDEVWVHSAHRRAQPKSPPPKNNRKNERTHTEHQHLFDIFLAIKNTGFWSLSGHKQQRLLCLVFGFGGIGCGGGGRGQGITMLMVEAVGIGGGEQVEGFRGDGKGERNGRHVLKIES